MAEKNYRLCVSCRKTVHRDQLWRIVRTYENHQVQLDQGMGRSAYLCPTQRCLSAAQKKNRLGRVLRTTVPPDIYQTLEKRIEEKRIEENYLETATSDPSIADTSHSSLIK